MNHLERVLAETASARHRLIVTDGVFSMDGDVAPMQKICELAKKYDAQVFIDEVMRLVMCTYYALLTALRTQCHATGFFGKNGRGTAEYCNVEGKVDIINSTLGKALGGATGGYTTGPKAVIDLLRQRARPYLFSNSVTPAVVGASLEAFRMLSASSAQIEKLQANVHKFRSDMTAAGFTLGGSWDHPIAPVMIGDAKVAAECAEEMLKRGIYVVAFSYPVVPKGKARIRVQLSAAHSLDQVQRVVDAFIEVGKLKKIIS